MGSQGWRELRGCLEALITQQQQVHPSREVRQTPDIQGSLRALVSHPSPPLQQTHAHRHPPVVQPRVSTEGSRRTMALRFAIWRVPSARQVVTTAGSPSAPRFCKRGGERGGRHAWIERRQSSRWGRGSACPLQHGQQPAVALGTCTLIPRHQRCQKHGKRAHTCNGIHTLSHRTSPPARPPAVSLPPPHRLPTHYPPGIAATASATAILK
jgi:hypothetical protein